MRCQWRHPATLRPASSAAHEINGTRRHESPNLSLAVHGTSRQSRVGGQEASSYKSLPAHQGPPSTQGRQQQRQRRSRTQPSNPQTPLASSCRAETAAPQEALFVAERFGGERNEDADDSTTGQKPAPSPRSAPLASAVIAPAPIMEHPDGGLPSPHHAPSKAAESPETLAGDGLRIAAATSTDFDLVPPWAAVHVGSHDLSQCPLTATEGSATPAPARPSRLVSAPSARQGIQGLAQRFSVIPRRRTFSVFREWLEEGSVHSRKKWGPRGQYPARRGLSHSATTGGSRRLGSVAAEYRNIAERKARLAVETEVRELSISKTPQEQQEIYTKAQQQVFSTQEQQQKIIDEAAAKKEAQLAAAEAAAAAASAALAQAEWPSRHKLQQQQLHKHHQEPKAKPRSAAASIVQKQPTGPTRGVPAKSSASTDRGMGRSKQEQKPAGRRGNSPARVPEPAASKEAEVAVGAQPQPGGPVTRPLWSASPPLRCQPAGQRVRQPIARNRSSAGAASGKADQGALIDYGEAESSGSGEEGEREPLNPLNEVLSLLQKAKRADSYAFGLPTFKKEGRASSSNKQGRDHVHPSVPATDRSRALWTNPCYVTAGLGGSEAGRTSLRHQQQQEMKASNQALASLKLLPLEAFDTPEEYGESSPRKLLQRCRSECAIRHAKARRNENGASQGALIQLGQFEGPQNASTLPDYGLPEIAADPLEERFMDPSARAVVKQQALPETAESLPTQTAAAGRSPRCKGPIAQVEHEAATAATAGTREDLVEAAATAADPTCDTVEGEAEAEVLHFVGSTWSRIPCVVLRYDPEQLRFDVRLRDGTLKAVRRLALRFCFEAPQQQQQRLETCSSRRRRMLLRQQFLHSVNGLPSAAFSPLPQDTIASIVKTSISVGRLRRVGVPLDILRPAVQCLRQRFLEAAKLSAVLHCAECLRAKGTLHSALQNTPRHQQLKRWQDLKTVQEAEAGDSSPLVQLLQPLLSTGPPAVGRPDIGARDAFKGALAALKKKPLFVNPKVFKLSLLLEGKFSELGGLCFFDLPSRRVQRLSFARIFKRSAALKPSDWTLPEPYQYLTYQQTLAYDVADALRELARDSVCHALISTFRPMQNNMSAAAVASPPLLGAPGGHIFTLSSATPEIPDSALRRQLIRFNLMLRSNLLSFVMDSAHQWRQYMLRAMEETVDPVLRRGAAAPPAAGVSAGFPGKPAVPPLLQLSIVLSEGSAVFHPPANKQAFTQSVPLILPLK